jgi:hypothetical protein
MRELLLALVKREPGKYIVPLTELRGWATFLLNWSEMSKLPRVHVADLYLEHSWDRGKTWAKDLTDQVSVHRAGRVTPVLTDKFCYSGQRKRGLHGGPLLRPRPGQLPEMVMEMRWADIQLPARCLVQGVLEVFYPCTLDLRVIDGG